AFRGTPRLCSRDWRMSTTALSFMSSAAVTVMSVFSSASSFFQPLRSYRVPHGPRLRVDRQDEPRERRQRLFRLEVEHPVALGVGRLGRVQEANAELGAQAPEAREEAPRGARQGFGRVADVDLVERWRVDPELLAVRHDLLGCRLRVLPSELAPLLEIDGALGRDRLVEALV